MTRCDSAPARSAVSPPTNTKTKAWRAAGALRCACNALPTEKPHWMMATRQCRQNGGNPRAPPFAPRDRFNFNKIKSHPESLCPPEPDLGDALVHVADGMEVAHHRNKGFSKKLAGLRPGR